MAVVEFLRVAPSSITITPHPIAKRRENGRVVVGRREYSKFVTIHPRAAALLEAWSSGKNLSESVTQVNMDLSTGRLLAIKFARLGLLEVVGDLIIPSPPAPKVSLRRLQPAHLQWILSIKIAYLTVAISALGGGIAIYLGTPMPSVSDILWSSHSGLVIAVNAAIIWLLIGLHELSHLVVARSYGVPSRISLGTRLQFLVAQTNVSGVWVLPRRARMLVYLSGIIFNLALASVLIAVSAILQGATPTTAAVFRAAVLHLILTTVLEFLVFTKTDIYYVLQDFSRSPNLHQEARKSISESARRILWWIIRRSPSGETCHASTANRNCWINVYAVMLLLGVPCCIAIGLSVTLPAFYGVVANAVMTLSASPQGFAALDAGVALLVASIMAAAWLFLFVRRFGGIIWSALTAKRR